MSQNNTPTAGLSYEDKIAKAVMVVADNGTLCLDFELEAVNAKIKAVKAEAVAELKLRESKN